MRSFLCQTLTGDRNVTCGRAKLYPWLHVVLRTPPNTDFHKFLPASSLSCFVLPYLLISWKSRTLHSAVVLPPVLFVIAVVISHLSLSEKLSLPSIWLSLSCKTFSWKVHFHLRFSQAAILRVFWIKTAVRVNHQRAWAFYSVGRLHKNWLSLRSSCLSRVLKDIHRRDVWTNGGTNRPSTF